MTDDPKQPEDAEVEETATPDEPVAETPAPDAVAAESDAPEEPATEADEPAADETPAEEPAPAAKKPAAKKKAAAKKKPAAKPAPEPEPEPVAEEPATAAQPQRRRDRDTHGGKHAGELVIVRAQARYVRSSARKARLVCDAVRGKSVDEARAILKFHPRAVAEAWEKLLESAVANAENNHDLNGEDLKIHAIYADEGPTLKRFRPRAMGRATRIRKRTAHLTIHLTPKKGG